MKVQYEVTVTAADRETRDRFITWMKDEHAADMVAIEGCLSCQVLELDECRVRCAYVYTDRVAFDRYADTDAGTMRRKYQRVFHEGELSFERQVYTICHSQ